MWQVACDGCPARRDLMAKDRSRQAWEREKPKAKAGTAGARVVMKKLVRLRVFGLRTACFSPADQGLLVGGRRGD